MPFVFDHAFAFTAAGAAAAARMTAAGFVEGPANIHPGQGTANRRFFFQNGMLELLSVTDPDEVQSPPIAPTLLWERSQFHRLGACPIGIAVRATSPAPPPFASWDYRPPYLPDDVTIPIASASRDLRLPLLFVVPGGGSNCLPSDPRSITRLELRLPEAVGPCAPLAELGVVELTRGSPSVLFVDVDGRRCGRTLDLCPEVSLVLRW